MKLLLTFCILAAICSCTTPHYYVSDGIMTFKNGKPIRTDLTGVKTPIMDTVLKGQIITRF